MKTSTQCLWLYLSHSYSQQVAVDKVVIAAGSNRPEDVLFLLSDAVAAWYLNRKRKTLASALFSIRLLQTAQEQELEQLFSRARLSGRIKDDDIAVIRIEISR